LRNPVRLLIVDDSKWMRRAICDLIQDASGVVVAGEAGNGAEALELLPKVAPDVITLDVNMPVMDGLTALKHIMIEHPKPTVMLSAYTQEGGRITFDALRYGAIDFIPKPSRLDDADLSDQRERIVRKIMMAASVELEAVRYFRPVQKSIQVEKTEGSHWKYLFAMGASIGGYSALLKIIPQLRPDLPATYVVTLYTTEADIDPFIRYLDEHSSLKVKRALGGTCLKGGVCYIASGEEYVTLRPSNGNLLLEVNRRPFPNHQGAINMLMFSIADVMKDHAIGVILSGSGEDGVEGIGEILRRGGIGIVQDPPSCLCPETAKAVLRHCRVDLVLSDGRIPSEVNTVFL
jgi:two-component system, chemotaxis family, protein-glutamate methylesterase/glutaminase